MRRLLAGLVVLIVLLSAGCSNVLGSDDDDEHDNGGGTDNGSTTTILSPGGETTIATGGVRIDLEQIYWVELDEAFVQPEDAIAIDLKLTNTTASEIEYLGIYSWGVMVTDAGEQIETIEYLMATNTEYFDGQFIVSGAFIRDTISFDEIAESSDPSSFRVLADPPIEGAEEFEIHFDYEDVETKPPQT